MVHNPGGDEPASWEGKNNPRYLPAKRGYTIPANRSVGRRRFGAPTNQQKTSRTQRWRCCPTECVAGWPKWHTVSACRLVMYLNTYHSSITCTKTLILCVGKIKTIIDVLLNTVRISNICCAFFALQRGNLILARQWSCHKYPGTNRTPKKSNISMMNDVVRLQKHHQNAECLLPKLNVIHMIQFKLNFLESAPWHIAS